MSTVSVTPRTDEQSDSVVQTQARNTQNRWDLKYGSVFPWLSTMREPGDNVPVNRRGLVSSNQGVLSAHCQSKKQLEYVPQGLEPHGRY